MLKTASVQLDSRRRSVSVGQRSTVLQEKTWQVLRMLIDGEGQVVSRTDIVDSVWHGNYETGEKGLNQALWALRGAFGDDARDPRYIRTVTRIGYQWIHCGAESRTGIANLSGWKSTAILAALALALVTTAAAYLTQASSDIDGGVESLSAHQATSAYRRNQDIVVEMSDGCVGILEGSADKELGAPMLSLDGSHVAFTVNEFANCRLVTVDLKNGDHRDFGACPVDKT